MFDVQCYTSHFQYSEHSELGINDLRIQKANQHLGKTTEGSETSNQKYV